MRIKLALITLLLSSTVLAQNKIILSGIISDKETKQPIPYAYVFLKNEKLGTVSDELGQFQLTVSKEQSQGTLIFSYIGYSKIEIAISSISNTALVTIQLKSEAKLLEQVVVRPQKQYKPKELLKKVLDLVPDNYSAVSSNFEGYYRETLRENNGYIKYADAVCSFHYTPYTGKDYSWKDFVKPGYSSGSLSYASFYWGARLHRGHFLHRTLKDDQVLIVDSRASADLSKTRMHANIEGGPLNLLGNDFLKFHEYFLSKKEFKYYDYSISEELLGAQWYYVLSFAPKINAARLDSISSNKKWWKSYRLKKNILAGKMYVDQQSFAVVRLEYAIPPLFKKFICGYTVNAIKHFDYKVSIQYQQHDGRWHPFKIRQEDEFIINDTTSKIITPYAAVSELEIYNIRTDSVKKIPALEIFSNVDENQLYDYATEYNESFWNAYHTKNPQSIIPLEIRRDMEIDKLLEKQFADKHQKNDTLPAPLANKIDSETKIHGETIQDPYAWLKDVKAPIHNKAVMEYLEAENAYANNYFLPLRKVQRNLFTELMSRLEKNFESLPTQSNGYNYYHRFAEDDEYPMYYRKLLTGGKEEILLDVKEMARDKEYYNAAVVSISPNNTLMGYYENTDGTNNGIIKFKNLQSNTLVTDSLQRAASVFWISDQVVYYAARQPKTDKVNRVMKHILGTPQLQDEQIFEESDEKFELSLTMSRSKEFLFLSSNSKTSSELHFLRIASPNPFFRLLHTRAANQQVGVVEHKEKFYLITNENAIDYKVMVTDTARYNKSNWKEFIPYRKGTMINDITFFDNYYVINEKVNAQNQLRVVNVHTQEAHTIKTENSICHIELAYNPYTTTDSLQYSYSSFNEPQTIFNYHMGTRKERIVKKQTLTNAPMLRLIETERVWVTASDGKKIPLTLVYNKWMGKVKNMSKRKVFLTSYGSYGAGQDAYFSPIILSLLDRGFIYAVAHVRGGNDMGMQWYEDGKLLNKKNTFSDFIACADYLVNEKYVLQGNIVAQGGSAGGLLMGVIANSRPELFKAIILDVPFVDVVNTMLDDKLPLTTIEYEEWGNPRDKKYFEYMKSYSPYDNVKKQAYPSLFFFTGLNDRNVGYWEPAKMVAKLRQNNTGNSTILLKTDFYSGHGGASGRYSDYREIAYKFALVFDLFDKSLISSATP